NCIMLSGYKHMAVVEKVSCRTGVSFLKVYQFGKNGFITTVTIKTTDLQKIFVNPYSDKLLINGYMGIKWQN
ncbi:MAG: hypothetical protein OXD32_04345, partial [Endozoicomonadaceae bacterium]|nr:hypothetical protein [Endozoicomonadaceae bacterium]